MAQPYREFTDEAIADIFTYHAPTAEQANKYGQINAAFQTCATAIIPLMPDGPGKTVAVRALSDARMKANAAIALEGKF